MTSKDSSSIRVFAGLPLPDRVVQGLSLWTAEWKDRYSDWKVVSSHALHITLHFFGDIPALEADRISGMMDDLKSSPIRASLAGVGCFPEKGPPRVLFVGLNEGCEEIKALYKRFQELIRTLGYREDKKEFIPHITIARRRRGVAGRGVGGVRPSDRARLRLLPNGVSKLEGSFKIDQLILYESHLKPDGAEYIPLKQVPLL